MDPTLFFLTWTAPDKSKHFMLLSMHTDDFDAIGSHDDIFDEFNRIVNTFWTLIPTDVIYMLGWQRIPVYSDDKRLLSITLTMTAYVKGMANAFRDRLPKRNVNEPFNPKSRVCKDMEVDPAESKLVLEAGYLKGVGLVLWAVRHSFPEGKFGISILGSVAHKSSWLAFEDLMWMIKWIERNQDGGIRFSADGNPIPFGMADASNKPVMSTWSVPRRILPHVDERTCGIIQFTNAPRRFVFRTQRIHGHAFANQNASYGSDNSSPN